MNETEPHLRQPEAEIALPRCHPDTSTPEELRAMVRDLALRNEELRLALAEAESARAHYSEMLDAGSTAFAVISATDLILEANRALSRMLGVERSELSGQLFTRFLAPDSLESFRMLWVNTRENTEPRRCELHMCRGDGVRFRSHAEVVFARDSRGASILCLALESIESRSRLKNELVEKEERLALATLSNGIGIWECVPKVSGLEKRLYNVNTKL